MEKEPDVRIVQRNDLAKLPSWAKVQLHQVTCAPTVARLLPLRGVPERSSGGSV
jgi:hypothetical protein